MNETTEQDDEQPWRPIANRGELTLVVHTRAHAEQLSLPMAPGAQFVGDLHPDDGPVTHLNFLTLDSLQLFLREMAPRSISVSVGRFEDPAPLVALLERDRGTVH